ncbi:MAG: GDP-mannose 4,6-dehydratase, partial [Coriobacteriales bacterium]|nr:GDP-mannose 4,6-dehydratase [Coriobacteriales bacterium]
MKTYLVTGGAGFIGSNYILNLLGGTLPSHEGHERDVLRVVNVDALTYAGNLENLQSIEGDERHSFVQADICDQEAMREVFESYQPDYVLNFAAESHVDRSITNPQVFVETNVLGTLNLLNNAKRIWQTADGKDSYREGVRFLQVSTDEVYGSLGPEGFFT